MRNPLPASGPGTAYAAGRAGFFHNNGTPFRMTQVFGSADVKDGNGNSGNMIVPRRTGE
jgi:hypothetical protein